MLAWLLALLPKLAMFNFAGILPALGGVAANIKANWRYYLPVLLVCVQLGTLYEWKHTHDQLIAEQVSHKNDNATFKNAQADANAKAQQIKQTLQKESKANADQADARYATLLVQYRSNLLRYQANQSITSGPYNYQLPTAESSNGPGSGSDLPSNTIHITLDDAGVCAINTARLQAVHDWAVNPPKGN